MLLLRDSKTSSCLWVQLCSSLIIFPVSWLSVLVLQFFIRKHFSMFQLIRLILIFFLTTTYVNILLQSIKLYSFFLLVYWLEWVGEGLFIRVVCVLLEILIKVSILTFGCAL